MVCCVDILSLIVQIKNSLWLYNGTKSFLKYSLNDCLCVWSQNSLSWWSQNFSANCFVHAFSIDLFLFRQVLSICLMNDFSLYFLFKFKQISVTIHKWIIYLINKNVSCRFMLNNLHSNHLNIHRVARNVKWSK